MSLRVTLRERMMVVWAGEPWHGKSSKAILADVTAAEAATRVIPGAQTIWEGTLHQLAWTEEVAARLTGGGGPVPTRGDWPTVAETNDAAWAATLESLKAARYALLAALEKAHEEELFLQVPKSVSGEGGSSMTRAQTVAGLIDHDIYHMAQIAMLKKVMRSRPV
ncbi:MAG: DinB family protein [Gemmatimonadetes bacterium]|nr:DinB family protein [Gemmatimonadota bacterium]